MAKYCKEGRLQSEDLGQKVADLNTVPPRTFFTLKSLLISTLPLVN